MAEDNIDIALQRLNELLDTGDLDNLAMSRLDRHSSNPWFFISSLSTALIVMFRNWHIFNEQYDKQAAELQLVKESAASLQRLNQELRARVYQMEVAKFEKEQKFQELCLRSTHLEAQLAESKIDPRLRTDGFGSHNPARQQVSEESDTSTDSFNMGQLTSVLDLSDEEEL